MAIYNRWGDALAITANLGKHLAEGFVVPSSLVEVRFDDMSKSFRFVDFLKADGGWKEINDVVEGVPYVKLSEVELKKAIEIAS